HLARRSLLSQAADETTELVEPDHREPHWAVATARPADRLPFHFIHVQKFSLRRHADRRPGEVVDMPAATATRLEPLIVAEITESTVLLPAPRQPSPRDGVRV